MLVRRGVMGRSIAGVLGRIGGRGYGAYKDLLGASAVVRGVSLEVVRVQSDPFAPPSVVRAEARVRLPADLLKHPVPVADYLLRSLREGLRRVSGRCGEGRSCELSVPRPGPVMLRRSASRVVGDRAVFLVRAGLPSRRRRVLAGEAEELLLRRLPSAVEAAVRPDPARVREWVRAWLVQEGIRARLGGEGLVSFVGDGSILPRACGGCEEPLEGAVPFESPPSMRVEFDLGDLGTFAGMGVPRGVTVIAGSAFHGKTTLAEAIAAGVWNHVPGDGRELVVTIREAAAVRSEDGRRVSCVDISPMIHDLPSGEDTACFSTDDASGATSLAASIQESVEAGAEVLILDEDTSATNMLYSDPLGKKITRWRTTTPLAELARSMREHGISLIIVSSGSSQLIAVADKVVLMEAYRPRDITEEAGLLIGLQPEESPYALPRPRAVAWFEPLEKPKVAAGRLQARNLRVPVDLLLNPHLVEEGQMITVAHLLSRATLFRGRGVREVAELVDELMSRGPAEVFGDRGGPAYSEVRGIDVAYALNRLSTFKAKAMGGGRRAS